MATELTEDIRELLNHPWKRELLWQDKVKWNKIWASLDTFDDTQLAVEYYLNLNDFDSYSGGYLFVYGVMQALSLQQDALNNLLAALFDKMINWKEEYPKLYEIREHRNNSVGHPTKRGKDKSFHLIARHSISKEGFRLASYFPKTGSHSKFENIDILDCIGTQNKLLKKIIAEAMDKLIEEIENHKNNFKGIKISDKIPNSYNYHVSKLFDFSTKDCELTEIHLNLVEEAIVNIKEEIEKRYFKVSALSGVELTINIIDYILSKFRNWLKECDEVNEYESLIFIEALRKNSKDLFEMVDEIDAEFE